MSLISKSARVLANHRLRSDGLSGNDAINGFDCRGGIQKTQHQ